MRRLLIAAALACAPLLAQASGPAPSFIPGCVYMATPPTLSDGQQSPWLCDSLGKLITNGSGGGGGTPGGANTQVQYNQAGSFGGITGATTDGTTLTLVAPVLGTPTSATLTNATGLPISTGVSGLGTGVATALAANVTGSGGIVLATSPTLVTPALGAATATSLAVAGCTIASLSACVLTPISTYALDTTMSAFQITNPSHTSARMVLVDDADTTQPGAVNGYIRTGDSSLDFIKGEYWNQTLSSYVSEDPVHAQSAIELGWYQTNFTLTTPNTGYPGTITSISNASPAVVTAPGHALITNNAVYFTTTGTLPSPLVANTVYYVVGASITTNTFQISATPNGAAINTTTNGSGIITMVPADNEIRWLNSRWNVTSGVASYIQSTFNTRACFSQGSGSCANYNYSLNTDQVGVNGPIFDFGSYTDLNNGYWGVIDMRTAHTMIVGSNSNGTGVGNQTKFEITVDGANKFDFGVTTTGFWTSPVDIQINKDNAVFLLNNGVGVAAGGVGTNRWAAGGGGSTTDVAVLSNNSLFFYTNNSSTPAVSVNTSNTATFVGAVIDSTNLMVGSSTALTLSTGEVGLAKIAASGSAPGAAGGKFELVCGTNAGSAKLIVYAGTSTTPVTIIDNIGSGVTGC